MDSLKSLLIGLLLVSLNGFGQVPIDIKFYLNNSQVSKTAKDFYKGKFKPSDDNRTMSILDSLNTRNNSTRPFYIYLVSTMMQKSDGALSEALGNAAKNFIERHPNEAVNFLYANNRMVEKKFLSAWAKQVAGEFMIDCEGGEKQCVRKSLKQTLAKTKSQNKTRLTQFYSQIESNCH